MDLEQLQSLLERHMPFQNAMLVAFDVPDPSSSAEWPPIIHFDLRVLYHREIGGFRAVHAWVCNRMIVRATWAGDIRNVRELEGKTLEEVFGVEPERHQVEDPQVSFEGAPRRYSDGYKLNRRRGAA